MTEIETPSPVEQPRIVRRLLPLLTDKPQTIHELRPLAPDIPLDDLQTEAWQLVHEGRATLNNEWKLSLPPNVQAD